MKHLLRLVLPITAVAAAIGIGAPAAQAHTDVCTGQFVLTANSGLGIPIANSVTTSFSISQVAGICLSGTTFSAGGSLDGACGIANGSGVTNTGHRFTFQLVSEMVFTGQVTGNLSVVEDPTDAGTCATATAARFILTGTLLLTGA